MTIDGPSGAGGPLVPPVTASSALRMVMTQGWLEGRVAALLGERGYRVATAFGPLIVTEAARQFAPGDLLRLRFDARSGRVWAEPFPTAPAAINAATTEETASPAAGLPFARSVALPSAVLAGLQPLLPGTAGLASGAAPPPLAQPPDPLLFAFLAGLFPQASAEGRGSERLRTRRRRPAYWAYRQTEDGTGDPAEEAEEAGMAEQAEPNDAAGPDDAEAEAVFARLDSWLELSDPAADASPEADEAAGDDRDERAGIEVTLAEGGRLRLDAKLGAETLRLEITSDRALPDRLIARIRERAERFAVSLGVRLDFCQCAGAGNSGQPAGPPFGQPQR